MSILKRLDDLGVRGDRPGVDRIMVAAADKIENLLGANAELLAALECVANNRLSTDVPDDEKSIHNYAKGWDALISHARAAIAKARSVK